MTPAELSDAVQIAVYSAVQAGELDAEVPRDIHIERTRTREHGDYATNIAMQLAKPARKAPREVAEVIAGHLRRAAGIRGSRSPAPASSTSPSTPAPPGGWPTRS